MDESKAGNSHQHLDLLFCSELLLTGLILSCCNLRGKFYQRVISLHVLSFSPERVKQTLNWNNVIQGYFKLE